MSEAGYADQKRLSIDLLLSGDFCSSGASLCFVELLFVGRLA